MWGEAILMENSPFGSPELKINVVKETHLTQRQFYPKEKTTMEKISKNEIKEKWINTGLVLLDSRF